MSAHTDFDSRAKLELALAKIAAEKSKVADYDTGELSLAFREWWDAQKEINGGIPSKDEFISNMGNVQLTADILYEICYRMAEYIVYRGRAE